MRAAAIAAKEHGIAVLTPALDDPDRAVVLTALEALDAAGGGDVVPTDLLDGVFRDAAEHAARSQRHALRSNRRTGRCAERWTTSSISHVVW